MVGSVYGSVWRKWHWTLLGQACTLVLLQDNKLRPVTLVAVFARQALPHAGLALGRSTADLARWVEHFYVRAPLVKLRHALL